MGRAPMAGQTASADSPGGDTQRFVADMDIPSQWWTLFKSPPLNQMVEQALKANPNVGAAQAALRQAHELYLAQRDQLFPHHPRRCHRRPLRVPSRDPDEPHQWHRVTPTRFSRHSLR